MVAFFRDDFRLRRTLVCRNQRSTVFIANSSSELLFEVQAFVQRHLFDVRKRTSMP